jgi:hypothetical protein
MERQASIRDRYICNYIVGSFLLQALRDIAWRLIVAIRNVRLQWWRGIARTAAIGQFATVFCARFPESFHRSGLASRLPATHGA